MEFLPASIDLYDLFILITSCFIGAIISTTIGTGGGLLVIGGMSLILPITALLSIHASVQAGSGIFRAYLFRKTFLRKFFVIFFLGSLIGFFFSTLTLISLDENILKLFLGLGIILFSLLPNLKIDNISNITILLFGVITGFLTMFVGVVAPLLGILLSSMLKDRVMIVGTLAWCISFQNFGKALIFGQIGFDYSSWIVLIILLVIVSYLGTIVGKKLLKKSNNTLFEKILKVVILILGSKLIIEALIYL